MNWNTIINNLKCVLIIKYNVYFYALTSKNWGIFEALIPVHGSGIRVVNIFILWICYKEPINIPWKMNLHTETRP